MLCEKPNFILILITITHLIPLRLCQFTCIYLYFANLASKGASSISKMQAALPLASSSLLPLQSSKTSINTPFPIAKHLLIKTPTSLRFKASASAAADTPEVDYNSMASSVFPAEACETVGGVACDVEMFPETKPKPQPNPNPEVQPASETVDREYMEYNGPKTVFLGEACDDLGGEFCDPNYQTGAD